MKEKNMKRIGIVIFRFTVCCILIILIYYCFFSLKKDFLIKHEFTYQPASAYIIYQIESLKEEKGKIAVEGFFFQKTVNSNIRTKNVVLLLHDLDLNKNIYLNTENVIRQDVNDYFKCEYDYSNSGFRATVKKKLIDLENGKYQFYLQFFSGVGTPYYFALDEYLIDGEIYCVDISEKKGFNFEGTELEEFFRNAKLRACKPEYGMCVYQKGAEFYWVADETFAFPDNGQTYIPFQMNTTQVERLPEEWLRKRQYRSNLGFYFEDNEIFGNYGRFRVTKAKIPTEYSVTDIFTGYHDGSDWIWQQYFFMDYEMFWKGK